MREIVAAPDFLNDNFLSNEARIPVTLLRTNACSPLASNAIRDNIWDNFSSETYKDLPSVGKITVQDPFTGARWAYQMPGGGRGFTRVPSLVSIWSTAPFLLNNRLGQVFRRCFGRGADESLQRLDRAAAVAGEASTRQGVRRHYRADDRAQLREHSRAQHPGRAPAPPRRLAGGTVQEGFRPGRQFQAGADSKGLPVNLAANYQPVADVSADQWVAHEAHFAELVGDFLVNWPSLDLNADDAHLLDWAARLRGPLLKLLKCPDFVLNRGHYFGTSEFNNTSALTSDEKSYGYETPLSDSDKRALIEFVKTF